LVLQSVCDLTQKTSSSILEIEQMKSGELRNEKTLSNRHLRDTDVLKVATFRFLE
jgi:hypothetical protein